MLNWSLKRVFGGVLSVFIVILTLFNIHKTNSESPSIFRGKIKSIETPSGTMQPTQGYSLTRLLTYSLIYSLFLFQGGSRVLTSFINNSSKFPFTLYGTAWKKEATASLVELALNNGFRSIDTACKIRSLTHSLTHSLTNRFLLKVNQNITMKRVWAMVYKLP